MNRIVTKVEAKLNPTEDSEKVKRAISNIFPATAFETVEREGEEFITAILEGKEGVMQFYNLLRIQRIRTAARAALLEGIIGNTITFYLNKQAAYARHISFSQPLHESPLGPIKVEITCDNPQELIEWLTKIP